MDTPNPINYTFLISSATRGIKYNVANSLANNQHSIPHIFTLSLKSGSKPPVSISPVQVWFGAGTVKISSFICLVGIGFSISTYIIYKIYKQVFPVGVGCISTLLIKSYSGDGGSKSSKTDVESSCSSTSATSKVDNGNSQIVQRTCRRRKVSRSKQQAIRQTLDSDGEVVERRTTGSCCCGDARKQLRTSGRSTDLGFVSMKSGRQTRPPDAVAPDDVAGRNGSDGRKIPFGLVDDHSQNRFVITPVDLNAPKVLHPHCPPCPANNFESHGRMHSTPDSLRVDADLDKNASFSLDVVECQSGSKNDSPEEEIVLLGSVDLDSGSETDRTGGSSSQPSSEMFETAKDFAVSATLDDMEQLQRQLGLLSLDVDDLNDEVETLQKREDPKESVIRRYTLGTAEALTVRKRKLKKINQKKIFKSKNRYLSRLGFQSRSCETKSGGVRGSDRSSEDGIFPPIDSVCYLWDCSADDKSGPDHKNSFITNTCSELERLSQDEDFSDRVLNTSDESALEESNVRVRERGLDRAPNKTFLIAPNVDPEDADKNLCKRKKEKLEATDDLYIDDDLISPDGPRKMSVDGALSPIPFDPQSRALSITNESESIYRTPEKWPQNDNERQSFDRRFREARAGELNFINNNVNINLVGELLSLSSPGRPLSPRTSDFLTACLGNPGRVAADTEPGKMRRFMEKIGEAVVSLSTSGTPLRKRCRTLTSTPNNLEDAAVEGQTFLSSVEKMCSIYPLWMVKNLDGPLGVSDYVGEKLCASPESSICQGYKHASQLVGVSKVCLVRRDNFCAIRATLCQAIISNKLNVFTRKFSRDHTRFLAIFEEEDNKFLQNFCFSNRLPCNKGSELATMKSCFALLLGVLNSQESIHSEATDASQRSERLKTLLDSTFNGRPIVDLHLMEAIKMVMMIEALELYKAFSSSPSDSAPLAWTIFSGRTTRNPEQLFKNRICAIGDTLSLNRAELSLLAYSLKIKLEVLKPEQYLVRSEEFVAHYPDEGADAWEKVTLLDDGDGFLLVS